MRLMRTAAACGLAFAFGVGRGWAQEPVKAPPDLPKAGEEKKDAPARTPLLAEVLKLLPPSDGPRELALKEGIRIVCMGDSITQFSGYLHHINAVLAQQYAELKIPPVINAGKSGNKAENLAARFEKDVLAHKPQIVTISIGINDVGHRLRGPHQDAVLQAYKENVTKLVEQAQAAGARLVLLAPTVISEDVAAEGNVRLKLYVGAMREIAQQRKCGFADLHQLFLEALKKKPADAPKNWLTSDGVHMGPKGNAIMAIGTLRALGVPDEKLAATLIPEPVRRSK